MTSRERIDSVIDVYNNVSPELETFEKVIEERDELREQNKQLWKIIEKQRLIVHQLQKIVNSSPELKKKIKMESNGNKVPLLSRRKDSNSKNDIKKNDGENNLNQDSDNNSKEKVEGNEILEESIAHTNKPSLVEDLNFDNEISRAQKTQSIIDEKFQLKPLEDVTTLDQEIHSNAIIKNEDEWNGNQNKLKGKMGLHKASSAPRLYIPNLKNNLQSSHMISLDALNSKQDKELVSPQDSKSKLSIPPRSNLRNRGDPPIVKENEKKYLPTIVEKEEMLRLPNNRIPDLRKGKTKKADLNNDFSSEVNLSRNAEEEEKANLIYNSQINNTTEVASIEPAEKETVNKVHRSLSESSVRPPTALSQKSILKNNDEGSNIAENKKSHSKSTSLSSRFSNHRDSIPSVHSTLSGHDEAEDVYKTARTDPIDSENLGLEKEEITEDVKASNLSSDNQRPMIYIPSPPQAVPDTFDQNLNDGYLSSTASNDSDFDADAGFISNVPPEEEFSHLAIQGSKIEVFSSTSKIFTSNENQEPDFNPNGVNELNNHTNNNNNQPILPPLLHTDDETQKDIEVTELKENIILQESQIPEITEVIESEPNSVGRNFNEDDTILNLNQNVRSDIRRTRTSRSEEGFATFKEEIKLKKKQSASSLLLDDPKKLNQVLSTEKDVRNNHHVNRGKVVNESEESSNNSPSLIEKTQSELEEITKEAILIQKHFKKIKLEVHTIDTTSNNPTINLTVYGIPISCTTNDVNANFIQINRLEKTWKKMMLLDEMFKKELPDKLNDKMPGLPQFTVESADKKIEMYLIELLSLDKEIPLSNTPGSLWLFLVSDIIIPPPLPLDETNDQNLPHRPMFKSGKLLKRGKKLGKLKLRFFVLNSMFLEYFESEEGPHLGTINLYRAQISKSTVATLHSEQFGQYLYAITILENRKGNIIKHIFFINNIKDWEEWILALNYYANITDTKEVNNSELNKLKSFKSQESFTSNKTPVKNRPTSPQSTFSNQSDTIPNPSQLSSSLPQSNEPSILDKFTKKNKVLDFMDSTKPIKKEINIKAQKRTQRKTFHWNTKNFFADAFNKKAMNQSKVFGVLLEESILKGKIKPDLNLPAVVYRCVEYLEKHQAYLEEGIYRLSGSSADIQTLKEKFDYEGDYNLVKASKRYDVHTIAGLLKLYLREMPSFILTNELQPEFVKIIELPERNDKVNELGRLVCALPIANYTTLRTLIAHLIRIVEKSDINKMTLRNIGIVFVPTLAIPAGVFSLMILEFEHIFWINEKGDASPKQVNSDYTGSQLTHVVEGVQNPTSTVINNNSPIARTRMVLDDGFRDNRNSILYRDMMPSEIVHNERGLNINGKELDETGLTGEEIEVSSIEEFVPTQYPPTISDANSDIIESENENENEDEDDITELHTIEEFSEEEMESKSNEIA